MAIKVYGVPYSTCTIRVLLTLFEKEVSDYELVPVDLSKGEHKAPEHLARQPFGQIPALTDGELNVFESRAIARYICSKFEGQGTNLTGKTLAEKSAIDTWLEVEHSNYNPAISTIVFEKVFKPMFYGQATDEERVAKETKKLDAVLAVYDSVLTKRPFLAGDHYSLADLSHLPYTFYLIEKAKCGEIIEKYKNVKAWLDRSFERASWKKVMSLQG